MVFRIGYFRSQVRQASQHSRSSVKRPEGFPISCALDLAQLGHKTFCDRCFGIRIGGLRPSVRCRNSQVRSVLYETAGCSYADLLSGGVAGLEPDLAHCLAARKQTSPDGHGRRGEIVYVCEVIACL